MAREVLAVEQVLALSPKRSKRKATAVKLVKPSTDVTLVVVVPVQVKNGMNFREHWAERKRRVNAEHSAVIVARFHARTSHALDSIRAGIRCIDGCRLIVTLTRLGGRKWDDDNTVAGLKGIRDAVAKQWLNCDDGDECLEWRYGWRACDGVGVEVKIEAGVL